MASLNKVMLIGNLGKDPEMRYLPSGEAVANFSVATTDKFKDKNGDMQEATEWHRVSFFGRIAEVCGQYLKKGSPVYVEGSIRTRKYTGKDGTEKYATEIRGDRMQMLGGRSGGSAPMESEGSRSNTSGAAKSPAPVSSGGSGFDDFADDIPF